MLFMTTMTKDEAQAFLSRIGELSPGLNRLFAELASKAEMKKEANVAFPDDPEEGQPWSPEIRFFHMLFEEMQVFMTLGHAVTALSEGVLQVKMCSSNAGNMLQLAKTT